MIDRACISLSSKCQLRCTYCHFDKHIDKNKVVEISEADAKKIICNLHDYAKAHQIRIKIGLVGSGEPLLRFRLIKMIIDYTQFIDSEHLLSFYTISNGMRFDDGVCQFFFKNRNIIKLCFSIDGYKAINDLCRLNAHGKGAFDTIMKSVELYKKTFGEAPSVNATVHKETILHAEQVLDFFERNFSNVTFSRLVDIASPSLYISRKDFQEFLELAKSRKLDLRQFKTKKYDCTMYGQLCGVGRTNIYFDNGKVYPCGRFVGNTKYELGNATAPIGEIERYMVSHITPCADGQCFYDNL